MHYSQKVKLYYSNFKTSLCHMLKISIMHLSINFNNFPDNTMDKTTLTYTKKTW